MLAFVTSLRHPLNSADYGEVERLLADTLASVTNQSSTEFVVIVVGNKKPDFPLPERVHFVGVDFDPPVLTSGPTTPREPFVRDKGTKIGVALVYAKRFQPTHVMIFDADDFVHRDLAKLTSDSPDADGWIVENGLMYSSRLGVYRHVREFNRTCGTCHIVRTDAYSVPDGLELSASQEEILAAYGETLPAVIGAHRNARQWFADHSVNLQSLSFPGAIYHVDTGENHSGKGFTGLGRPLDSRIATEFGISARRGRVARAWNAWGPLAAFQSLRSLGRRISGRLRRG